VRTYEGLLLESTGCVSRRELFRLADEVRYGRLLVAAARAETAAVTDEGLARTACEALDRALVVWWPASGEIDYANPAALIAGLAEPGGGLTAAVTAAAADHRARTRRAAAGSPPAPQRFRWRGAEHYLETRHLGLGRELVAARPRSASEAVTLARFQTRFRLTDRQTDVLKHLLRGRSSTEIAAALHINVNTVRRHRAGLLAALAVARPADVFHLADELRETR
jgi:DNA-binding CsgD family transcriptional regulator